MGQNFAFSMLKSTPAQKSTPRLVGTNINYDRSHRFNFPPDAILWCETFLGWIGWLIGRRGSTSFTFQFMLESSVSSSPTTSYFSRKNGKRQKWQNNIFRHWSCTKSFTIPRDQILVTYLGFKVIKKDNWKKGHLFLMPFHPISDVRITKICSKWDNALEMWGNFSSATFRVCPLSSSFH